LESSLSIQFMLKLPDKNFFCNLLPHLHGDGGWIPAFAGMTLISNILRGAVPINKDGTGLSKTAS
jgi:hypothetical protein